ncbi:MAG TPA: tRNA (adenosine(37)-N6)-threonylcarbamoyltransferase complex ATPase subunit type 1 TsaE [Candidatus Paceibacterota bacterium]
MKNETITYTIGEIPEVASKVIEFLRSTDRTEAVVVGLNGDLGAGKTTFSKEIARQLGVTETVTSPTFVIQKTYPTTDPVFQNFVHIDAYRLDEARELSVLGFEKLVSEPENLIFVEWPERVADILPGSTIQIHISVLDEHSREMKF